MLINHCPACWCVNANEAVSCSMCGADLNMADADAADTLRLPLEPHARRTSGSALWLDDLVGPRVSPARQTEPDTPSLVLTLRDVGSSAAPQLPQSAQSARAARRAAVRRARRSSAPAAPHAAVGAAEVLVVGNPNLASEQLCGLLQTFGFAVHTTADTPEAIAHSASPALLASFVFADMADGSGGNGIDLCSRLRQASAPASTREVLLVLVAAQLRPMDRVRAELAGCDDAIPAPVSRGDVAKLLDARGIRLPSDPRRA